MKYTRYAYNPMTDDLIVFKNLKAVSDYFGVNLNTLRRWKEHGRPIVELAEKEHVPALENSEKMQGYEIYNEKEWKEFDV